MILRLLYSPNMKRPTKKANLDKLTAVRIDPADHTKLQDIGRDMDRPVSWVIRKAVQEFIERYKPAKS